MFHHAKRNRSIPRSSSCLFASADDRAAAWRVLNGTRAAKSVNAFAHGGLSGVGPGEGAGVTDPACFHGLRLPVTIATP